MTSALEAVPTHFKWTGANPLKSDSQRRLYMLCFPYAGAGASVFREWALDLPSSVDVRAIQIPGRENRWSETPFTSMSSLVKSLSAALDPLLDLPFVLFGHSMGALVSFEFARQLRRETNKTPVHLFISGARAPQIPDPDPPIHQLPDLAFIGELQRLNGIPESVLQDGELMRLVLPTLRADLTLCENPRVCL